MTKTQKTVYEWAIEFVVNGISVIPVNYKTKTPKFAWEKYKTELPTEYEIYEWFGHGKLHNYGVVVGWKDLVILDFDDMKKYYEWNLWTLDQADGSDADRAGRHGFRVSSGRGVHVYLRMKDCKQNRHISGLDIKGNGMCLGPGSTHATGKVYGAATEQMVFPVVAGLETVLPERWMAEMGVGEETVGGKGMDLLVVEELDAFDVISGQGSDMVAKIKRRFRLEAMIAGTVQTGEHWFMGLCPFHEDRHPSFWIDSKKQIGNCQRCCFAKPLDVINLFARMNQLGDDQAIKIMAKL
jgi:hypothetical protein